MIVNLLISVKYSKLRKPEDNATANASLPSSFLKDKTRLFIVSTVRSSTCMPTSFHSKFRERNRIRILGRTHIHEMIHITVSERVIRLPDISQHCGSRGEANEKSGFSFSTASFSHIVPNTFGLITRSNSSRDLLRRKESRMIPAP